MDAPEIRREEVDLDSILGLALETGVFDHDLENLNQAELKTLQSRLLGGSLIEPSQKYTTGMAKISAELQKINSKIAQVHYALVVISRVKQKAVFSGKKEIDPDLLVFAQKAIDSSDIAPLLEKIAVSSFKELGFISEYLFALEGSLHKESKSLDEKLELMREHAKSASKKENLYFRLLAEVNSCLENAKTHVREGGRPTMPAQPGGVEAARKNVEMHAKLKAIGFL